MICIVQICCAVASSVCWHCAACGKRTLHEKLAFHLRLFPHKLKGDIRFGADEIAKLADLLGVSTDVLLGREPLEVS